MNQCPKCSSNQFEKNDSGERVCIKCSYVIDTQQMDNEMQFYGNNQVVGEGFNKNDIGQKNFEKIIETTFEFLKRELQVEDEYMEAFERAKNLLKLYATQYIERWQHPHIYAGAGKPFILVSVQNKLLTYQSISQINLRNAMLLNQHDVTLNCLISLNKMLERISSLRDFNLSIHPSTFLDSSKNLSLSKSFNLLFITRDKQQNIIETGKKLVKRMMLDWMSYGRRPSSLCGAALLISARFHGENLTTNEICKTVFVCDETIRKRLAEFNQTKLAQLTVEQFDQIQDIEKDIPGDFMDPPAFTNARKKEENDQKMLQKNEELLKKLTIEKAKQLELLQQEEEIFEKEEELVIMQQHDIKPAQKIEFKQELSDLEEEEVQEFILTKEESNQKKILWTNMYGEWMRDKEKMLEKKKKNQDNKPRKKRQAVKSVNAPDPQTAIMEYSRFGKDINKPVLDEIFPQKKVKIESMPITNGQGFLEEIQNLLKEE